MKPRTLALSAVACIGGIGLWSKTDSFEEMFCFNPTGYCGSNVPDRNRVGGPQWIVNLATPEERTAFFTAECERKQINFPMHSCFEGKLRQSIHDSCVSLSPKTYGENPVTTEEEDIAVDDCKTKVLGTHNLELNG